MAGRRKMTSSRKAASSARKARAAAQGRPSRYSAEMAAKALELCQAKGFSEAELAEALGVPRTTLRGWMKRHKPLRDAVDLGRSLHDSEVVVKVERSLVRRAMGATVKTRMRETAPLMAKTGPVMDREGKPMLGTTTREVVAEVPPDTAAARFVLSRMDPRRWPEKPAADDGEKAPPVQFTMILHAGGEGKAANA